MYQCEKCTKFSVHIQKCVHIWYTFYIFNVHIKYWDSIKLFVLFRELHLNSHLKNVFLLLVSKIFSGSRYRFFMIIHNKATPKRRNAESGRFFGIIGKISQNNSALFFQNNLIFVDWIFLSKFRKFRKNPNSAF